MALVPPTRHQVVFFNGPRRSGKDTAARFIQTEYPNVRHRKFAGPLKRACAEFFGVRPDLLAELEKDGSRIKTDPLDQFFGMSWVQALIWFSEEAAKPKFGKDVFGRLLANELLRPAASLLTIISDSGFEDEAWPVIRQFGLQNCHVFRILRDGHTFKGDSRSYIFETPPDGLHVEDINNDFERHIFRVQVLRRIDKIMGVEKDYSA